MRSTTRGLVMGVLLMVPMACRSAADMPSQSPIPAATVTGSRTPAGASPTQAAATASATMTPTPSYTPTADPTRIAGMTLEAIRLAVTAGGVPEGSMEFEAQVAATRCAVVPPPTSTPMPWRLAPEQPYVVSANCLGSDLPGQGVQLWQDGTWVEARSFSFANGMDLEVAHKRYLAYLDELSFRDGPPTDDFIARLREHMDSTGTAPAPESCLADEIIGRVMTLAESGNYIRLTFTQPIHWSEQSHLFSLAGDVQLALPWSTAAIQQELVEIGTGRVIKQALLARIAGTAWLTYSSSSHDWLVADDDSGYYCAELPLFLD
jgi:hypothetical protein